MARSMGHTLEIPFDPVNFDITSFDNFIKSNGVELFHYKAVKCPIGMVSSMDIRSPHHEHSNCFNGYIYKLAGVVRATFTNNSATAQLTDMGIIDGSTVQATFPRFYEDSPEKRVYVQLFDRFYIKDLSVLVSNTQLFEAHVSGIDKMTYKVEQVEYVIDSNGKEYSDADFAIIDGKIRWTGSNTPTNGFDASLNKGMVCSIKYLYTPFFYASRLLHEVRIAQKSDFKTGTRTPERVPYAAFLSREYYMYKGQKDDGFTDGDNAIGPSSGIFGPK
jgi:hypothetical protein